MVFSTTPPASGPWAPRWAKARTPGESRKGHSEGGTAPDPRLRRRWRPLTTGAWRAAAAGARDHLRATGEARPGNGHSPARPQALAFGAAVEELAADGIVLRDAERGLVDFPATAPDGRRYWLCWVVGEPSVAWWHWPEDGFAGRKPLDERPR